MSGLVKSRVGLRRKARLSNPRDTRKIEAKLVSTNEVNGVRARIEAPIVDRAIEVIGDKVDALRWLGTPVRALDYATPISLIATAAGRRAVLSTLDRLEHGVL